jgi:hypothetical protein
VQWTGLYWLKQDSCTDIIASKKSHWTRNRHLNNKGQEWKMTHAKERVLMGEGVEEGRKEGKYGWCIFYKRMNRIFKLVDITIRKGLW